MIDDKLASEAEGDALAEELLKASRAQTKRSVNLSIDEDAATLGEWLASKRAIFGFGLGGFNPWHEATTEEYLSEMLNSVLKQIMEEMMSGCPQEGDWLIRASENIRPALPRD